MKMYVIHAATINTDKAYIVAGAPSEPVSGPVPYYLIQHEKGYVLFDTGHNLATVEDVQKGLPEFIYHAYKPDVYKEGFVLNALEKIGVKPEEIMYVVCSHLHFDHCGGMGYFPNATYIVQKEELNYAYNPDTFMQAVYFREDFDKNLNWMTLDGWNDNKYDIFGDGKLIIYFTPGHTPGHQSLLVNLEKEGSFMLTVDACYNAEILDGLKLSALACDNSAYIKNLKMFKEMQKRGITIIIAHDPEQWKTTKTLPEFYE